ATAQDVADHRHVQVDAGGDVWRRQTVAEQQVGQQQVIDVAAVAGHIDDLLARGDVLHVLQVVDLDPVVQLVPEPGQHHLEETDDGVGEVRGDLVGVAGGTLPGAFEADVLLGGLAFDGGPHQ